MINKLLRRMPILILCSCSAWSYSNSSSGASTSVAVYSAAGAAAAAHSHRMNQNQQQIQRELALDTNSLFKLKGVMTCQPTYKNIKGYDAYDMWGCDVKGETITIEEFFRRNKRHQNHEILSVVYNDHALRFIIYYGDKK